MLLPFIEQAPLHAQINFSLPALPQVIQGKPLREVVIKNLLCPSDTTFKTLPHGFGYTTYAGNAGWDSHRRLHGDERLAGVFTLMDPVGISDIRDGTSNVIMVGEVTNRSFCCRPTPTGDPFRWKGNSGVPRVATQPVFRSVLIAPSAWTNTHAWIDAGGGPLLRADGTPGAVWGSWANPHAFPPVFYGHYPMGVEWPGAGSHHPSGAQFTLADGSVKFIKDNISNGGQINPATGTPVVGDAYGRYGNIWGGAHEIQKIQGATTVVFN
jgi:hypothetical protein